LSNEDLKKELDELKKTLAALQEKLKSETKEESKEEDAVDDEKVDKTKLEEELKKVHPGEVILYALKKNLISRSKTD